MRRITKRAGMTRETKSSRLYADPQGSIQKANPGRMRSFGREGRTGGSGLSSAFEDLIAPIKSRGPESSKGRI